jgi:hypothetical protein
VVECTGQHSVRAMEAGVSNRLWSLDELVEQLRYKKMNWFRKVAVLFRALALIAALGSAWFWIRSARITTPTNFHVYVNRATDPGSTDPGGGGLASFSPGLTKLSSDLAEQSRLNGYAAYLAAANVLSLLIASLCAKNS